MEAWAYVYGGILEEAEGGGEAGGRRRELGRLLIFDDHRLTDHNVLQTSLLESRKR